MPRFFAVGLSREKLPLSLAQKPDVRILPVELLSIELIENELRPPWLSPHLGLLGAKDDEALSVLFVSMRFALRALGVRRIVIISRGPN